MLISGINRVRSYAGDTFVHPLPDRAVGIVVEGVHARVAESILAAVAVPALPHRGGALVDGEEPRRISFLETTACRPVRSAPSGQARATM